MTTPASSQYNKASELDPNFSTTRLVTQEKPIIENNPSSKVQSVLFLAPNPERKGEGGLRTKGYFKRSYDEANNLSDQSTLPLVTIITVVFNGEKHLEQTIQSVINQTYNNVEYIIIDGGSTDGTVDILLKDEDRIDYWVSEPDEGIYDAMNKGIIISRGDLLLFLNCGDYLCNQFVVGESMNNFILNKDCQAYSAATAYVNEIGDILKTKSTRPHDKYSYLRHQGFIYRRDIHENYGMYNITYKINSDYDFYLKIIDNINIIYTDKILSYMTIGGFSSRNPFVSEVETLHIHLTQKLPIWKSILFFQYRFFKGLIRYILIEIKETLINLQ